MEGNNAGLNSGFSSNARPLSRGASEAKAETRQVQQQQQNTQRQQLTNAIQQQRPEIKMLSSGDGFIQRLASQQAVPESPSFKFEKNPLSEKLYGGGKGKKQEDDINTLNPFSTGDLSSEDADVSISARFAFSSNPDSVGFFQ